MFHYCRLCAFLFFVSSPLLAATINVPGDAATLHEAMDLAQSGDTVLVASGDYHLGGETLYVKSGVTLLSQSGTADGATIFGDGNTAIRFFGDGFFRVRGFTIRDCANAAVRIVGDSPFIEECRFEENTFTDGGAIHILGGSAEISGCTFVNNSATHAGGAVAMGGACVTMANCYFEGNVANYGGAVDVESGSQLTLAGCEITNNTAQYYGGALNVWANGAGSGLTAYDSTIMSNSAPFAADGYADVASWIHLFSCNLSPDFEQTFDGPGEVVVDGVVDTELVTWGQVKAAYR